MPYNFLIKKTPRRFVDYDVYVNAICRHRDRYIYLYVYVYVGAVRTQTYIYLILYRIKTAMTIISL